ncbi:MAG: CYTH domain-containing protein [Oscillospiraceae bacterium]
MPYEIERKYLIAFPDDPDSFTEEKIEIVQTYLTRTDPALQRRVRSMTVNGVTEYYYTEKRFVTAVTREERERKISEGEYAAFLTEADPELTQIIKTRRIFHFDGQKFEMDSYPFSDELATVEAEIENENSVIHLPPFLDILREVTGDKRYSNANLAANQAFPK